MKIADEYCFESYNAIIELHRAMHSEMRSHYTDVDHR